MKKVLSMVGCICLVTSALVGVVVMLGTAYDDIRVNKYIMDHEN